MKRRSVSTMCNVLAMLAIFIGLGNEMAQASPRGEGMSIELEIRAWMPTLSASIQSSETSTIGDEVDLESTLGVDTRQNFLWPKVTLHFADRHRLSVSYLNMRYSGDKIVTQEFTFGGITFNVDEAIHSEVNFDELAAEYQYDFLKFSWLAASANLQARYLDIEGEVRGATQGTSKEDFQVPVPTIGVGIRVWPVEWLKVSGDFNVFKLGISAYEAEVIDSEAALTFSPWAWDWFGLSVGYVYYRVLLQDTDSGDRADWFQKGPYAAATARF